MGEVTSAAVILFVPSVVSGSELGFTSSRATQLLPPHPPETDGDGDVVDPNRRSSSVATAWRLKKEEEVAW